MANYSFSFILPNAFAFSGATPSGWVTSGTNQGETTGGNYGGASWSAAGSFTLTYNAANTVTVGMSDGNYHFEDDQANQLVTSTSNTGVAAVGANLENEYEVSLKDAAGNIYRMAAVSHSSGKIIGYTFQGTWPASGTVLSYVKNSAEDRASVPFCFLQGTLIATPRGEICVEDLKVGDLVLTMDHGVKPLRWVGRTHIPCARLDAAETIRPIRIRARALGEGLPARDLLVSPQHRVLVRSRIAERMFGQTEVLVAAKRLLGLPGVEVAHDVTEVVYHHILFDQHEVVLSNGAWTESLYPGAEVVKTAGAAALEELFALFPALRDRAYRPDSSRVLIEGARARRLAERHLKNSVPLVSAPTAYSYQDPGQAVG